MSILPHFIITTVILVIHFHVFFFWQCFQQLFLVAGLCCKSMKSAPKTYRLLFFFNSFTFIQKCCSSCEEVSFMTVINGCRTSQFASDLALKRQLRHFLHGTRSTPRACGLAEALLAALRRLLSDEQVTETRFSSFSLSRKARGEGEEVRSRGAHVFFCVCVEETRFCSNSAAARDKLGEGQTCQNR